MKQFTRRRGSQKASGSASQNGSQDLDQTVKATQHASNPSLDAYSFPDEDEPAVAAAPQATTAAKHQAPKGASTASGAAANPVGKQEATTASAAEHSRRTPPLAAVDSADHVSPPKRTRVTPAAAAATGAAEAPAAAPATRAAPSQAAAAAAAAAVPAGNSKRPGPPAIQPRAAASGAEAAAAAGSGRGAASGGGAGSGRGGGRANKGTNRSNGSKRQGSGALARAAGAVAAGSGGGRAASGGGKRSRQGSPNTTKGQAAGTAAAAAAGTPIDQQQGSSKAQQQPGSRTPAVSLPTPRRPVGLVAAAGLLATAEGRPAQTVMEAQERGELVQLQDDARYAMDGLAAGCSLDTQRESAVTLTDMLCSRRGRMALRADGLAQQVLSSLAKLKAAKDAVLGLAATIALLMLTSEDAHPAYLASVAGAVLIEQLLQSNHSLEEAAGCGPSGAKLAKLLKARPLCTLVATTGVSSQRELLLITLEQATSSQQASKVAAVEKLKHNLRQYGALQRLGKLAAAAAQDAAAQARELHMLLLVLENATFTCQANGSALVQLQVTVPAAGGGQEQPFPAVLVSAAQQLLVQRADSECRQALHVCLSVLMNLSHQNPDGSAVISEAGGLAAAAATIVQLLGNAGQDSHQALCKQVLKHLELLSVALGVLINLVSGEPYNSRRLAGLDPAAAAAAVEPAGSDRMETDLQEDAQQQQQQQGVSCEGLVPLLCTVVTAVGRLLQQQEEKEAAQQQQQRGAAAAGFGSSSTPAPAAAAGAFNLLGSPRGSESASGSASGHLDGNSAAGEASIIEVYCGMLLGFLVRDCADLAPVVAKQLEGGSLQPVVGAVQRCLHFYVSTGAITEYTKVTLEELLQHLNSCA